MESLARSRPASAAHAAARPQDLLRPARRFERESGGRPGGSHAAIDRLREAPEPDRLRELLDRRHDETDGPDTGQPG